MWETVLGVLLLNILIVFVLGFLWGIIGFMTVQQEHVDKYPDFWDCMFGFVAGFIFVVIVSAIISMLIWAMYWAHYLLW